MYPTPQAPGTGSTKELKPNLVGVRNKQRKGVAKAQAKFEPQVFRDQLVKHLESVPEGDFDAVAAKLDLDYRKYEEQFFQLLLVGALLAPGGGIVDDGAPRSTFSVIGSAKEPVELAEMKKIVDVFNKLMRRYKYLQKPFEESAVKGVLQYTNKFNEAERQKLAYATALFISTGLVSANVLVVFKKEHLIKENVSLNFFITFCKAYLQSESVEHLSSSLRKGGVIDLELFLPVNKQSPTELSAQLKAAGLNGVVEFYSKQKTGQAKEDLVSRLKELVHEEADHEDIESYLETQHKRGILPDTEFIAIVWQGLFAGLDPSKTPDQVIKDIKEVCPTLEIFCTKPSTEVALINTIQVWTYENTKLMPAFAKILKLLYSTDVLSDQSIIYWHGKGSKPQARAQFLAATQPLVSFLQEQEDESDEE
ncbi:hypothetical protein MNV49_001491 [Pseudohyphozyma bogoriensis]|nr:hypothetical protein MNV49_001491 [Pseudohyphozyma bogoriensis]